MEALDDRLERWREKLCPHITIGGLLARSPIAHKWKAPARCLIVRETLFWRMLDLGQQTSQLIQANGVLGALILIRSALETLGLLIHLNDKVEKTLTGELCFLEFEEASKKLLMGSRDKSTSLEAINILTVLEKADRKYRGLAQIHRDLSEIAHPNYAGVMASYAKTDREKFETHFHNGVATVFGWMIDPAAYAFEVFEVEYNWTARLMKQLEEWLEIHDEELERERTQPT